MIGGAKDSLVPEMDVEESESVQSETEGSNESKKLFSKIVDDLDLLKAQCRSIQEEFAPECPDGHRTAVSNFRYPIDAGAENGWFCDKCHHCGKRGEYRWFCEVCLPNGYDLCFSCIPPLVDDKNRNVSMQTFDNIILQSPPSKKIEDNGAEKQVEKEGNLEARQKKIEALKMKRVEFEKKVDGGKKESRGIQTEKARREEEERARETKTYRG